MSKKVVIVGGHGQIALKLSKLLSPDYSVISIVRDESQFSDVSATGAKPLLLCLEADDVTKFASVFEGCYLVYFSAGAGEKGYPEKTKKIDYEGAIKVFDAIELVSGPKPRLILVSGMDTRADPTQFPDYYNEADIALSKHAHQILGIYMRLKYLADKNLHTRTAFKWVMVRPSVLTNDPGTGKVAIGRVHVAPVTRDDIAKLLALLAERPDAAGLSFDVVGGETEISLALDAVIKEGVTCFTD